VSRPPVTVLFVSSNGTGMGHLARLTAMARRRSPAVRPQFLSMSRAVPVVAAEGFPWEYVPSRADLAIGPRRWNRQFERRMFRVLARDRPAAVVFDGTFPYDGLLSAVAKARAEGIETRAVWSRRGMWRPGGDRGQLARSGRFDLVIAPGELAADADAGATAGRTDAVDVGPITLLDVDELLPRDEAAKALGIDPDRPAALLTLGAGNVRDLRTDRGLFLDRLLAVPDLQIVLTHHLIADQVDEFGGRVYPTSVFPISRYLRAVDFAVAAAGYNSFHELVGFGIPTAFVPNPSMPLDDQPARAKWAAGAGAALCLTDVTAETVDEAVTALADPSARAAFAARCREVARPNGAGAAMAAIEALVSPDGVPAGVGS
jgi:UDP:flavonoid glycosyltransferase YjiC (YdhE family)